VIQVAASANQRASLSQNPGKALKEATSNVPNGPISSRSDAAFLPNDTINDPVSQVVEPVITRQSQALMEQSQPDTPAIVHDFGAIGTENPVQPAAQLAAVSAALENATQLSSSDSAKPSSVDGKSFASTMTFGLDEKESLRPDDSASVKATDEEEPGSAAASSRFGSDTGARAFRDQLHEIAVVGPQARQPGQGTRLSPALPMGSGPLLSASPMPGANAVLPTMPEAPETALSVEPFPPDENLLEALNSPRDRLWVLKLEQDVTDFVKDST